MKKKIITIVLALALVMTSGVTVSATAGSSVDTEQVQAEKTAEIVEDVVGTKNVVSSMKETSDEYIAKTGEDEITIPKDGDEKAKIVSDDSIIAMGLPDIVEGSIGVVTDDGAVVYEGKYNTSLSVQALYERKDGVIFTGTRASIIIESANSPKSYSFDYYLPKGARLIKAEDYYNKIARYAEKTVANRQLEHGSVFVVDENDNIIAVIEPAWAEDANGNSVETSYGIMGNTLIQYVEFDKNAVFPIVADPSTRPDRYIYDDLTKAEDKIIYKNYAGLSDDSFWDGLSTLTSIVAGFLKDPAFGTAWTVSVFMSNRYYSNNKTLWGKMYNGFDSEKYKYLRIKTTYRWHPGHQSYYQYGDLSYKYIKK